MLIMIGKLQRKYFCNDSKLRISSKNIGKNWEKEEKIHVHYFNLVNVYLILNGFKVFKNPIVFLKKLCKESIWKCSCKYKFSVNFLVYLFIWNIEFNLYFQGHFGTYFLYLCAICSNVENLKIALFPTTNRRRRKCRTMNSHRENKCGGCVSRCPPYLVIRLCFVFVGFNTDHGHP